MATIGVRTPAAWIAAVAANLGGSLGDQQAERALALGERGLGHGENVGASAKHGLKQKALQDENAVG
jgi:hypothetical protein